MNIVRLNATAEHATTLAKWVYEEWDRHRPDGSIATTELALRTMPDATGLPLSFVALRDGAPVGMVRLVAHDMESREDLSPWLAALLVPVAYRGNGIGTELCHNVVAEAAGLGFATVYLFTRDRESFYSRQGWRIVERTDYRDKNVVVMRTETAGRAHAHHTLRRAGDP